MTSIDLFEKNKARVLSVGSRFETELLYLWAYGYRNARGVDLISYSPYVDLGNMHALPYEDNSWDIVLMGWVISYSDAPEKAASEILRVVVNGGLIAIGVAYAPENKYEHVESKEGEINTRRRLQTVEDILALWGNHVQNIYFRHDAIDPEAEGSCLLIFSVRK